jgi:hypothetical protein
MSFEQDQSYACMADLNPTASNETELSNAVTANCS